MSTLHAATPGQTVGPFFGYALPFDRCNELVPPGSPGAILLRRWLFGNRCQWRKGWMRGGLLLFRGLDLMP